MAPRRPRFRRVITEYCNVRRVHRTAPSTFELKKKCTAPNCTVTMSQKQKRTAVQSTASLLCRLLYTVSANFKHSLDSPVMNTRYVPGRQHVPENKQGMPIQPEEDSGKCLLCRFILPKNGLDHAAPHQQQQPLCLTNSGSLSHSCIVLVQ